MTEATRSEERPAPAPVPKPPSNGGQADGEHKFSAALSYLPVFFIYPLVMAKDHPFVRFHLRQGLLLFLLEAVISLFPVVGWMLAFVLVLAGLYGASQTLRGKYWEMPLLGKYAKKITL